METETKYVVVKHAGINWDHGWDEDPKITGVIAEFHTEKFSHTGRKAGCEFDYSDRNTAEAMALKMNRMNPCGDYAVCPTITIQLATSR